MKPKTRVPRARWAPLLALGLLSPHLARAGSGDIFEASVRGSTAGIAASAGLSASRPDVFGLMTAVSAGTLVTLTVVEISSRRGHVVLKDGAGGAPVTVPVPPRRLREAGLQPGDMVELRRGATGAMVIGNGKDIAYLVDGNAQALLRSSPRAETSPGRR